VVSVDRTGCNGAVEVMAASPRILQHRECLILFRVSDEVALGVGRWRVRCHFWHEVLWIAEVFIFSGASQVCFSQISRGVFSLTWVDRLVWRSKSSYVLCLYG
jgi:hypothetical protein